MEQYVAALLQEINSTGSEIQPVENSSPVIASESLLRHCEEGVSLTKQSTICYHKVQAGGLLRRYSPRNDANTVYIGGGTPTALPSHLLCKILQNLPAAREITVEANPGTLTPAYLAALKSHGVTRLSMGLQTTHPHLLKAINRLHTMDDFLQNYHAAISAGFDNINVDLMFALPGQTLDEWQQTLEEIITLAPQHISLYSLTPAENTPLWAQLESDEIILPSEETDRAMYHMAIRLLQAAGYIHYELSNFAKPGYESHHNMDCWRRVPYRGYGLGAHSFDGYKRWNNTENMQEYLAGNFAPQNISELTEADIQSEVMFLGLRIMKGIAEQDVPHIFAGAVEAQIAKGLLERESDYVRLTPKGTDLANQVFEKFV